MSPTLASSSMPRRRLGGGSLVILVALLSLVAGMQAFAPASASAMDSQTTECRNEPPPGFDAPVPGMGWNGSFVCKLDSAGAIYGGTGKTPTQTDPLCGDAPDCLPDGLRAGRGGSGRESGFGEVRGSRGGGVNPTPPAKPKPKPPKAAAAPRPQKKFRPPGTGLTPAERWIWIVNTCQYLDSKLRPMGPQGIANALYYDPELSLSKLEDPIDNAQGRLADNIARWIKDRVGEYELLNCAAVLGRESPFF